MTIRSKSTKKMDSEKLAEAIDRLDNLAHGLKIPMSPSIHVEQLKIILPTIVKELKEGYVELTEENPWEWS